MFSRQTTFHLKMRVILSSRVVAGCTGWLGNDVCIGAKEGGVHLNFLMNNFNRIYGCWLWRFRARGALFYIFHTC